MTCPLLNCLVNVVISEFRLSRAAFVAGAHHQLSRSTIYDYLPDGMVSVSLADWSEFWSKMDTVSSTAMSFIRRLQSIVLLYMILILLSTTFVNNTAFWVFFVVQIAFLSLGFCYLGRAGAIDSDIQKICNEYEDQFEEQGVYIEFRRERDWTVRSCLTVGGIFRRYIYLFPIQESSEH
jgi:hypothetical protein